MCQQWSFRLCTFRTPAPDPDDLSAQILIEVSLTYVQSSPRPSLWFQHLSKLISVLVATPWKHSRDKPQDPRIQLSLPLSNSRRIPFERHDLWHRVVRQTRRSMRRSAHCLIQGPVIWLYLAIANPCRSVSESMQTKLQWYILTHVGYIFLFLCDDHPRLSSIAKGVHLRRF